MNDKERAYNTVALKYYELQELKKIKTDLIFMEQDCKAKVKIKTLHKEYSGSFFGADEVHKTKKKSFDIAPQLLIQIIDKLIDSKKEYLDKAIDLTLVLENKAKNVGE